MRQPQSIKMSQPADGYEEVYVNLADGSRLVERRYHAGHRHPKCGDETCAGLDHYGREIWFALISATPASIPAAAVAQAEAPTRSAAM